MVRVNSFWSLYWRDRERESTLRGWRREPNCAAAAPRLHRTATGERGKALRGEERQREKTDIFGSDHSMYLGQVQTGRLASVIIVAVHVEDLLALDRKETREDALGQTGAHDNDVVLFILQVQKERNH